MIIVITDRTTRSIDVVSNITEIVERRTEARTLVIPMQGDGIAYGDKRGIDLYQFKIDMLPEAV